MVGDSLRADVEGAAAAGMHGVLLRRPVPDGEDHAVPSVEVPDGTPVIGSLQELPGLVSVTKGPRQDHRQAARRMA